MVRYNSGRVKKIDQSGITSDRYNFLGLEQAEPDLGDPIVGVSSVSVNPVPEGEQYVLIAVDGRTANARFLRANFQRSWRYHYFKNFDQHFFELDESPLGVWNNRQMKFTSTEDK